jgi:hypothetical protein
MLHWMRRVAATGVAAALLLSVSGCTWVSVAVKILDFNTSQVQGIWLWRADASGSFQREARYDFSPPQTTSSGEVMDYVISMSGTSGTLSAQASVQRSSTDPNQVALVLVFPRSESSGTYRVTSFNAAGESTLSTTQSTL